MKNWILLQAVILMVAVPAATAAQTTESEEGKLSATFETIFLSRYIWRGFDRYGPGGHSALQSRIDVDLYGSGFGVELFLSDAIGGGYINNAEITPSVYYTNSLWQGDAVQTDFKLLWRYYAFPDNPKTARNFQEVGAKFEWPEICSWGLIPRYTFYKGWPAVGNSNVASSYTNSGWIHAFGVTYPWMLPGTEQILDLDMEWWYNDGFGGSDVGGAAKVDHDWSHVVFGIATDIAITDDLTLTPGYYYQVSMEDTVNPDDENWARVTLAYSF